MHERPRGVGGWLLVLCVLLLVWGPISLGLVASSALAALSTRGLPLAIILVVRIIVTAMGIAAGLGLAMQRPASVAMAKIALVLSATVDVIVYVTPFMPTRRMPGDAPLYVAASLAWHGIWLTYLFRSRRVRNTYV